MQPLPQTVAISEIVKRRDDVMSMMENGPVVLMARSKPRAVMVDPNEWDRIAIRLSKMEGLLQAMEIASKDEPTIGFDELCAELSLDPKQLITSATTGD
ncbi:MAG: hypothetical protein K0U66_00910 [Gammaproteobacteria bacterium]|nr:hypothetical protein [Gammaproteobacteria bacterium]